MLDLIRGQGPEQAMKALEGRKYDIAILDPVDDCLESHPSQMLLCFIPAVPRKQDVSLCELKSHVCVASN